MDVGFSDVLSVRVGHSSYKNWERSRTDFVVWRAEVSPARDLGRYTVYPNQDAKLNEMASLRNDLSQRTGRRGHTKSL